MDNIRQDLVCPSCGSKNIEVKHEKRAINIPLSPSASYEAEIDNCVDCEFAGDFRQVNDKAIATALSEAKKASLSSIITHLAEKESSMAYMERALDLPARTMMRWKSGDFSAGALALMRIIAVYPWTIAVADAQFDPLYATRRLAQEGINAMGQLAKIYNVAATIRVTAAGENSIEGNFSLNRVLTVKTTPVSSGLDFHSNASIEPENLDRANENIRAEIPLVG